MGPLRPVKRQRIRRIYLFSAIDVIRSIETMEQLQSVAVDVWQHVPDASSGTRRKIRRALEAKRRELNGEVL